MLESFRKTLQAYTAGTSSTQDASQPHGTTEGDPASISVSAVAAQFNSLRLQERHEIPGAFPPTWDGDAPQVYDIYAQSSGLPDNSLETYLTAATLTATSLDTRAHNRVFSSSSAFYERSISSLPDSLASLGISDATDALEAVAMAPIPPRSPAFPTGHQFGRATFSDHLNPSPKASDAASKIPPLPPASRPGRQFGRAPVSNNLVDLSPIEIPMSKTETDAMKDLARTRGKVDHHQRQVLGDDFPSLSADTQHTRVHEAKAFATERLGHVEQLSRNAKRRRLDAATRKACQTADDPSHIETECKKVIELLRGFLMKVHAITALLPESGRPLFIDSDPLYDANLSTMDQINQVLILLAVTCNMIVGLSRVQTDFLVGVALMLVKLGMSTIGSNGSHCQPKLTPSQKTILAQAPSSLVDALKMFNADGNFFLYAVCPSCSFTNEARSLQEKGQYILPQTCENDVVGENGVSKCGAQLLKAGDDGGRHPIKEFFVPSLPDHIAQCLADKIYLEQSVNATKDTHEAIRRGESRTYLYDVFDGDFVREFKGPDGKLFVDAGDKIHLSFSIHVDFCNPYGVTHRGAHQSIGIISCANLALDCSIRYLPEYMFSTIIPGPVEPSYDTIDHFVRRVVEQFVKAWRPGIRVSRTADPESVQLGVEVEAAILLSVNDLPAARKVAGLQGPMSTMICNVCHLQGRDQVYNTDQSQWTPRDLQELRFWATAWKNAQTIKEREAIFEAHYVRWSSFWLLEYWDPTRMLVVDTMHCILEGLVHYHCRHVLRLDAAAHEVSVDGFKFAYDYSWTPYDRKDVPAQLEVVDKHIPSVVKIHETLSLALEGDDKMTLDKVWARLDNQGYRDSLRYVAYTLGLPDDLSDVAEEISRIYVQRAQKKSKSKGRQATKIPSGPATQKHHYIALLLNWRLSKPRKWDASISLPKTGTRGTLDHIQHVLKTAVTPSWLNSVPKNYGEVKAGSVKADEWRTLSSVYLPIALVTLWGDDDGCAPSCDSTDAGLLFRALDHTMALFQATIICCRHITSVSRADDLRFNLTTWIKDLRNLYPHVRQGVPRTIIHAAGHVPDFLISFGPVSSWWCFPFERLVGALQKINTNDHIGGVAEATMVKTLARTANIRRWLRRPDCPEAVRQLKRLFDKCFVPAAGIPEPKPLRELKGSRRAYANYQGVNFSPHKTHEGNASIIYRPKSEVSTRAGQIQWIQNINEPGGGQTIRLHVRPYKPMSKTLYDPFVRYPHLNARTYSSQLDDKEDTIELHDVVAHAARFDYSHGRSVFVNLSRD